MRLVFFSIISIVLLGVTCTSSQSLSAITHTLFIDGSSTVYPISRRVAFEYGRIHLKPQIEVHLSSTGTGIQRLAMGSIDIANASRPIRHEEIQLSKSNGIRFIELPIAYDGISVVVNRNNTWIQSISTEQLAQIWSLKSEGKIVRWNQVSPDWPDKPLNLVGPDKQSGTFAYFTKAVLGKSGSSRQDYMASEDDHILAEAIAQDEYALGYFGWSYYRKNIHRLRALAIDDGNDFNGEGPQSPTLASIRNKKYQPLSRPLFLYVSEMGAARPEVQNFVEYYLSIARRVADDAGNISLPSEVIQASSQRFRQRIYGTRFGGQGAIVGISLTDLLDLSLEELLEIPVS